MQFETEEKGRTLDEFIHSFGEYCDPKKNETVERHKFFTRNQESGETFDKYLTELRLLEKTCDFGTLSDSLLRDRIVCGLSSSTLRERLLREPNLNLKQCIDICRASEMSKERNKSHITLIVLAESTQESLHIKTSSQTGTRNQSLLSHAYIVGDSMSLGELNVLHTERFVIVVKEQITLLSVVERPQVASPPHKSK